MDNLTYETTPFLITKSDTECLLYFKESPSLYRGKQMQQIDKIPFSLSYFYVVKHLPPITNESFFTFLSKQYATKKIEVQTTATVIMNDKVIEKQLNVSSHTPILLIKKIYQAKSTVIAFERTYVNTNLREYQV